MHKLIIPLNIDYSGSLDDDDVGYESVDSGGHLSEDSKI